MLVQDAHWSGYQVAAGVFGRRAQERVSRVHCCVLCNWRAAFRAEARPVFALCCTATACCAGGVERSVDCEWQGVNPYTPSWVNQVSTRHGSVSQLFNFLAGRATHSSLQLNTTATCKHKACQQPTHHNSSTNSAACTRPPTHTTCSAGQTEW